MLGDCLERMKEIPDGSVDIFCDPLVRLLVNGIVIPLEPMWEQLKRVIKPNGAVHDGNEPFSLRMVISELQV